MPIRLDERLTRIASLIDHGTVADIGCDHGKLGYYLVGTDKASAVIATDISEGSLKKATELARDNGVSDIMTTRLGDGLRPVKDREVDTVVIAGLGGDVISEILAGAAADGKRFSHFVLSPNTHPEKVRRQLLSERYKIVYDDIVECGGKRYTVLKAEEGEQSLDDLQILFGAFYDENEGFERAARQELAYKRDILSKHYDAELENRIKLLEAALENVQKRRNI